MNPAAAGQSFELRRFPDPRDPLFRIALVYLAMIALRHWLFALGVVSLVPIYRYWRLRRPADYLRLTEGEIQVQAGLFQRVMIYKEQVEEVSPASKGVIIAWKKDGVPRYTRVSSSWFEGGVWRKACPALLAWGTAQV
jgi:hypothetical protein